MEQPNRSFLSSADSAREKSDEESELTQLKADNQQLESRVRTLTRELTDLRSARQPASDHASYGELKLDLIQTKQDLNRAKEALAGI